MVIQRKEHAKRDPLESLFSLSFPLYIIALSSLSPTPVIVLNLGVISILGGERWIIFREAKKDT